MQEKLPVAGALPRTPLVTPQLVGRGLAASLPKNITAHSRPCGFWDFWLCLNSFQKYQPLPIPPIHPASFRTTAVRTVLYWCSGNKQGCAEYMFLFLFGVGSVFEKTQIQFEISLVWFGLKNPFWFGYYSHLLSNFGALVVTLWTCYGAL